MIARERERAWTGREDQRQQIHRDRRGHDDGPKTKEQYIFRHHRGCANISPLPSIPAAPAPCGTGCALSPQESRSFACFLLLPVNDSGRPPVRSPVSTLSYPAPFGNEFTSPPSFRRFRRSPAPHTTHDTPFCVYLELRSLSACLYLIGRALALAGLRLSRGPRSRRFPRAQRCLLDDMRHRRAAPQKMSCGGEWCGRRRRVCGPERCKLTTGAGKHVLQVSSAVLEGGSNETNQTTGCISPARRMREERGLTSHVFDEAPTASLSYI